MSGIVETSDPGRAITLDLGRAQAILPQEEQVYTERYRKGQRVKVFLLSVRSAPKGPEILVSRSHRNMLRRLFEIEVPEVHNGVVEIKAIAREAGFRSKVAVSATQSGIDPVGSCIGIRGKQNTEHRQRVAGREDRHRVLGSRSPCLYLQLPQPVGTRPRWNCSIPSRQPSWWYRTGNCLWLSVRKARNTRLAARLTGWRLDIKGMSEWEQIREARLHAAAEAAAAKAAAAAAALAEAAAETGAVAEVPTEAQEQEAEMEAAVAEAVAIVEEAAEAHEVAESPGTVVTQEEAVPAVAGIDEDSILEALIREEEILGETSSDEADTAGQETAVGISVDDLDSFTLDEVAVLDDEEDEEFEEFEEFEEVVPDFGELPVLTPDAGKIRFAEDIVEDIRGRRTSRWRTSRWRRSFPPTIDLRDRVPRANVAVRRKGLAQEAAYPRTDLRGLQQQKTQGGTGEGRPVTRWPNRLGSHWKSPRSGGLRMRP